MNDKILITGATGTIGKALIKQLQTSDAQFIAGVRDISKAKETLGLETSQLVHFDFSDPGTFANATEQVGRIFLVGPPLFLEMDKLLAPFIDFVKSSGINRIVYLSALNNEKMGEELNFHRLNEEKLKASGFDWTILQPSFFAQNFKNYEWDNITQRGITYMPAGSGKVGFVDVNDIATVAAKVLTESGHEGKSYSLTGPEALSYQDAAQLLTKVTGKTVAYPEPSPEEYASVLKAAGAPDFIAPYMSAVYGVIRSNEAADISHDIEQVTGKKAASLESVLVQDFKA